MNISRAEYTARLNRVIDYIHGHLDSVLLLETLADVAGFSPFHFHRLFKSLVGETLNDYVQRARLEKAVYLLINRPETTVLAIGIACGFSGAAVFSRAFKAHFGVSPSQYRFRELEKWSKNRKADSKTGKDSSLADHYNGEHPNIHLTFERSDSPMNVEVKVLPTYHAAYIRHLSGYSKGEFNSAINQAFQRVCAWAAARDLFTANTLVIGIPYDNPDVTPNDRCRYDACVTIPETLTALEPGAGEVGIQDISGGKYAVTRIEVSPQETHKIGQAVDALYGEWLPSSGYTADDKPSLEIYYENPDRPAGTWITMDYCVPVRPL